MKKGEKMKKGKLIVIEGLDGSGKATQTRILCSRLRELNFNVCKVSFPNYSEPSSSLVRMYLNAEFGKRPEDVNAYAATSFFAVDRYASFAKLWKSRYEKGQIIVADRYTTSNAIYQLEKLPKEEWKSYINWMEDYEYVKLGLPKPDLVIYLDMPIDVSQSFMSHRYRGKESCKDLHEKNVAFLKRCQESAMFVSDLLGWNIVKCSDGENPKLIDDIHELVFSLVKKVILNKC
mgnify:FL=1